MTLAATIGVVGVLAQSQTFLPAFERYLWKAIGDWGTINNKAVTNTNAYDNQGPNEFNEDVLVSYTGPSEDLGDQFNFAFGLLKPNECTFSLNGDRDEIFFPRTRQCKDSTGLVATPPPLGHLLNPVGLAVDGTKVYVSDEYNHRIQVFDFKGVTAAELTYPIGDGVPGPDGLSAPYGIAVDASAVTPADPSGKRLLVADGGNGRVAIFKSDGSAAFGTNAVPIHFALPDGPSATDTGEVTWPSLVALTPGAIVRQPLSQPLIPLVPANPADPANHRIVVTDWIHCSVFIFDTAFNLIKSLPTAADYEIRLSSEYQHDACVNPDDLSITPPGPGEFSTVTGAAVDAWGRIYIADHAQNVVQVFDSSGDFLFRIGKPDEAQGDAVLNGPVGVTIDHLGRVAVTDAGNARVVFYSVSSPGDPLSVSVQFQLDTTVAFDDFPIGFAEQIGTGTGLDPKGRFIATNPLRRSVLRFELPDLVVANASADNGTGLGTFDVAVPSQKVGAVNKVKVTVTPLDANGVLLSPLPSSSISVLIGGALVAVDSTTVDLDPGKYASYQFQFPSVIGGSVRFRITAAGNRKESDQSDAVARASCGTTCGATHAVFFEDESPATPTEGWYGAPVFVRITPTSTESDPVDTISWSYGGVAGLTYGASVRETPVPTSGYLDVPVRVSGQSTIAYRAITASGTISPPLLAPVVLKVDLDPPLVRFEWKDADGGFLNPNSSNWYKQPVYGHYIVTDAHSGPAAPAGQFDFTDEGRAQAQRTEVADLVGHVADADSVISTSGRLINIDLMAPYFCVATTETPCSDESGLPTSLTFVATAQDGNGGYADVSGSHGAQASDPKLGDGTAGSGVAPLVASPSRFYVAGNGTAANDMTFSVTDYAGNVRTTTRPVIVNKKSQTITFASLDPKTYGADNFAVSATASSGLSVSFTASGSCTVTASGTVHLTGAGSCTITASQAGIDAYYEPAVDVVRSFTVYKAPLTVTADSRSKTYGAAVAFAGTEFTTSGLVAGDGATVSSVTLTSTGGAAALAAVSGSPYAIGASNAVGTGLENYTLTYADGALTVNAKALTVTVTPAPWSKTYGTVTAFAGTEFTADGFVAGDGASVTSVSLTSAGAAATATVTGSPYSVVASSAVGTGLGNYAITYVPGTLGVTAKTLTVAVSPATRTKIYGTTLTLSPTGFTATGLVNGDAVATVTLTSAGAAAGAPVNGGSPYPVAASNAQGTGLGNYTIDYVAGTLKVLPATPAITWATPASIVYPAALSSTQLNATASVAGAFVYTPAAGTALNVGPGQVLSVDFTPTDAANYTTASATVPITVLSTPANFPPVATDDSVAVNGTGPVTIAVLGNDTDPDGNALTIASVSSVMPAGSGTVAIVGNTVVFTPSASFAGTATFSYTVSDGYPNSTDTATVTLLSCNLTGFRTQSQGGWGAKPSGNNAGKFLQTNFAAVYSAGSVTIGGTQTLTFTSSAAIEKYLPRGGSPSVLTANDTNPTSGRAGGGGFAGQVLALQLSVDFSVAGVTRPGLGGLVLVSGPLVGRTVSQVLVMANAVLGGNLGALPPGLSISGLNAIVDAINNNFVGGTVNQGYLIGPGCTPR